MDEELVAIRDGMLGEALDQQASEVFLRTLADLVRFDHVRFQGMGNLNDDHKPVIGRVVGARPNLGAFVGAGPNQDLLEISTSLALAQVNVSLRKQGRSELKITERALLQQLREDGKLLDANGEGLAKGAELTRRVRLNSGSQLRAFTISRRELIGE